MGNNCSLDIPEEKEVISNRETSVPINSDIKPVKMVEQLTIPKTVENVIPTPENLSNRETSDPIKKIVDPLKMEEQSTIIKPVENENPIPEQLSNREIFDPNIKSYVPVTMVEPEPPTTPNPADENPTPEELCDKEIVNLIVKKYNPTSELVSYSANFATKPGDNFMSVMLSVDILIQNDDRKEEKISLMLKTIPRNEAKAEMINECGGFEKDIKFYAEVIPAIERYQEEKGIMKSDLSQPWPKCYIAYQDGKKDYLGMQNLRVQGYQMANKTAGLDARHTHLTLMYLAQYHAATYAMYGGSYRKILDAYPWLEERMYVAEKDVSEGIKFWMKSTFTNEARIVRENGQTEAADLLDKVFGPKLFQSFEDYFLNEPKNAVIGHGDLWTNNIMFKYDEQAPVDLKFVDFQLARASPRCIDLVYLFYTSLSEEDLNNEKLEEEYLKSYYKEFNAFLKNLGKEPDSFADLGGWNELKKEYENCRFFGVIQGLLNLPNLRAEEEDVTEAEKEVKAEATDDDGRAYIDNLLKGGKSLAGKLVCNVAINHLIKCVQMH